jgi:hypothetical protein
MHYCYNTMLNNCVVLEDILLKRITRLFYNHEE